VADNKELIANFSNSKSGWPCSSLYFLRDCPNLPVNCWINFFGSVSSSASTPASNGSSSNGLSSVAVGSNDASAGVVSSTGADGSSAAGSAIGSSIGASTAGSVVPAIFNLYLVSSSKLVSRLFFLLRLQQYRQLLNQYLLKR
jgi:hypothetical protein